MRPCNSSDPGIETCMLERSKEILPHLLAGNITNFSSVIMHVFFCNCIVLGDKEYKLPKLNPLEIDYIKSNPGNNLQIELHHLKIFGLERTKILHLKCVFVQLLT